MDVTTAILDELRKLKTRVSRLETLENGVLVTTATAITLGTLAAFDGATNTATVTIGGVDYPGLAVSYALDQRDVRAGVNVAAVCGVLGFVAPATGCVIFVTSAVLKPDAFNALLGHDHSGLIDQGPVLP